MPIDRIGSMVNLAKQWKMDQAQGPEFVQVPRATLLMLMDTLIELGTPDTQAMQVERMKTVADMIAKRSPPA